MRPIHLLACIFLLAAAEAGAAPISPGAFERMSEGNTLHFTRDGAPYGAEQYFPDRRVLWRDAAGNCAWGRWYENGGLICFQYEAGGPQCWSFEGDGGDFTASLVENGSRTSLMLRLSGTDRGPLDCPAPGVGS